MNNDEIDEMCEALEEYASMEGSEAGEYWQCLANMGRYSWMMGPDIINAYIAELQATMKWVKENFEIVETTHTHTSKTKELVEKV